MIAPLLALAMQANPAPAAPALDCNLVTPRGDALIFAVEAGASSGATTVFLVPAQGSAWPEKLLGGGAVSRGSGKKFRATAYFGAAKSGVTLEIVGERAVLIVGRTNLPRAYGFCVAGNRTPDPASSSRMVALDPGAKIAAFDSSNWPDHDCALVTRSGRRATIDYTILNRGAQSEIKSSDRALFADAHTVVKRTQGMGRSRFGRKNGPTGTESLVIDQKSSQAVQLLDFEWVGVAPAPSEPAAAICGIKEIIRRPTSE